MHINKYSVTENDETAKNLIDKQGIVQMLFGYLAATSPLRMFLHLIWVTFICAVLGLTYIITFHFTSLVNLYEEAHNVRNFSTNLVMSAKQDTQINDALNSLIERTDSNRAYVFRYHNGLAAVSGVPFFFQTNTHEVIKPGISRVLMFEQHIPASINLAVSNALMANRCVVISKSDEDKDSQNYWYYQNRGAKSLIRCPIFTANGDVFGFIGVDYTSRRDQKFLDSAAEIVKTAAQNVATIFATKK